MPSLYNKMQQIGSTEADCKATGEPTISQRPNNFPGGLWINGIRVDVEGRVARGLATDPTKADQQSKPKQTVIDLLTMD